MLRTRATLRQLASRPTRLRRCVVRPKLGHTRPVPRILMPTRVLLEHYIPLVFFDAKVLADSGIATWQGEFVIRVTGTPSYLSRQQLGDRGRSRVADPAVELSPGLNCSRHETYRCSSGVIALAACKCAGAAHRRRFGVGVRLDVALARSDRHSRSRCARRRERLEAVGLGQEQTGVRRPAISSSPRCSPTIKAPAGGDGSDAGQEWFEIYNNTDGPGAELEGLTRCRPQPARRLEQSSLSHVMREIDDRARSVLHASATPRHELEPAYVDYGYGSDLGELFNTGGGKLTLSCGATEIDSAQYTDVKAGHSRELTASTPPDYTLNDDQANWCQADASEFEPGNFGTPASRRATAQPIVIGACMDAGVMRDTVVAPGVGDLVITEVMPKPKLVSRVGYQRRMVRGQGDDRSRSQRRRARSRGRPRCPSAADRHVAGVRPRPRRRVRGVREVATPISR